MFPPEAAPLLYRELAKIATNRQWSPREQVLALAGLLERIFFEATRQEQLAFSTLFARISYAGHLYHFQPDTLRGVHTFRRTASRVRDGQEARPEDVLLGVKALAESVLVFCEAAIPHDILDIMAQWAGWPAGPSEHWDYKSKCRVIVVADDPVGQVLTGHDEENPADSIRIRYGLPDRNENFMPTIQVIRRIFKFPITLNLLDVDIDRSGAYRPRVMVVEPDYLMDISAISECFKDTGAEPYYYLVKKFLPYEMTNAMLLGNLANYFLDRLLHEPAAAWEAVFRETFQLYPLAYAAMSDRQVQDLFQKAKKHFANLRSLVSGGLLQQGIEPENSILEPTFFSEQYGIQGRLDLFYHTEDRAAIVELKSGTPFKPNSYGIQRSHFTQTLLYDLLVRSVFGNHIDPAKYILYSGVDLQHLRFAPTIAPEQWEALQLRNQLLGIERLLGSIRPGDDGVSVFSKLSSAAGEGKGFLQRDFAAFEVVYKRLSDTERKYFNAFAGFIAREQWLSKAGVESIEHLNGHASLWRSRFAEKQQAFSIISHLEIAENRANQPDPSIVFKKTGHTNPLANFRIGDIAVLYPALEETDTVLDHQVIKCTITELGKDHVTVQLRFRQFNLKVFETKSLWHLEPDQMENGFVGMYRGLFEWAGAEAGRRRMLMTVDRADARGEAVLLPGGEQNGLTAEQSSILQKIIHSKSYFLLWGPPGTGKTSVMLRALAAWVLQETTDNILLLAYTNRAVDEICEALDALGQSADGRPIRDEYVRIGSRYSTAPRFREQLLNNLIADVKTRAELREVIDSRRIFVSTVASLAQHEALLHLKKFQRLVVDEASQLLEPQIVGLLTRFDHFLLIGDHRQLPAVTAQRPETTVVDDPELNAVGLTDLRDSYFERLYRRCEMMGWDASYARLSHQGRMHTDIMEFPNEQFYSNFLKTLPVNGDLNRHVQHADLAYTLPPDIAPDEQVFAEKRVVFLPTAPEPVSPGQKTSRLEADRAAKLVGFFKRLYAASGKAWHADKTLGIITPWRAQIAQVRSSLSEAGLDPDEITIDTVERYQGGARDIIILSCCVHSPNQLSSLVSRSAEGIDRKLNVALTRARHHIVVLGNPEVLSQDEQYRLFIEEYSIAEPKTDAIIQF